MDNRIIFGIIAVVVVLLLVVFWPFGKSTSHTSTYVPPTNTATGSKSTTTVLPAKVEFYGINYQWVYNGPSSQNGNQCGYYSHTDYQGVQALIYNGSQNFDLLLNPSTGYCGIEINSINSSTPGFVVTSTQPVLPFPLPEYSNAEIQVNMQTPDVNYYGPLTITIHYS